MTPSQDELAAWLTERAERLGEQAKELVRLTGEGKQADAHQAGEFSVLFTELRTVAWLKGVNGSFSLMLDMLRMVARHHPLIVLPD